MSDLIIEKRPISQKQNRPNPKTAQGEVDYSKYQIGAKPFNPKGHLVNTPLWQAPFVAVEDTFNNIKTLGKGLKGEGDDHRLGQLNDLGLLGGGLAIAGYLASTKALPVKKGMEFVGFGSFLASMALFPVVCLQAPIQALYGFNVNQKYIDSVGRKKSFHMDPQYTPWDLYSDKKLNAIGDRMGIDRNIENRQSAVKERMTKIATQSNTTWMLAAGIAVPAMCGLLSSQAEKGVIALNTYAKTKYLNKKMENLSKIKGPSEREIAKLDRFFEESKTKPINEKFVDNLATMIVGKKNTRLKDNFKADLKEMLKSNPVSNIAESVFGEVKVEISSGKELTITKEEIKKALEFNKLNNASLHSQKDEPTKGKIKNILTSLYKEKANENSLYNSDRKVREKADLNFQNILDSKIKNNPMSLTDENITKLKSVYPDFYVFRKKSDILQNYITHKLGDNGHSVAATEWEKASNKIFKSLGFSDKEIKQASESTSQSRKILEGKFSNLAKGNDENYTETVKKIASAIDDYEKAMDASPFKGKTFNQVVEENTESIYDSFSQKLAGKGNTFRKSAQNLTNHFGDNHDWINSDQGKLYNAAKASIENDIKNKKLPAMSEEEIIKKADEIKLKEMKKSRMVGSQAYGIIYDAENKVDGGKNSLKKILQGLDLFKRIESGDIDNAIKTKKINNELNENYHKQFGEKIKNYMKYMIMEGDIGTQTVKADIPQKEVYKDVMSLLYCADKDKINKSIYDSKYNFIFKSIFNKEIDKATKEELKVAKIETESFAKIQTESIANNDLHASTKKALGDNSIKKFKANLFDLFDKFANYEYRFKTEHKIGPKNETTILKKQYLQGETLANFVHQIADKKYNTKQWLKMTGIAAAVVGTATLISPLFFGKVKKGVTTNG